MDTEDTEVAAEVTEGGKTYTQRVRDGEIKGPPFMHLMDDDTWQEYTEDEVDASDASNAEKAAFYIDKIGQAKTQLEATDYIAVKIAEGAATADEYASALASRAQLRQDINGWQEKIEALGVTI